MNCRRVASVLDVYLDGELPAEQTLEVEEHLGGCDACTERSGFESALRGSLRRRVRADGVASDGFESRLATALRSERERLLATPSVPPKPKGRALVLPLMLAAAATMLAVALLDRQAGERRALVSGSQSAVPIEGAKMAAFETPEQVLDELVDYHTTPPAPQITEARLIEKLEPEVGVPLRMPTMNQAGVSWEGGGVVPMRNQRAALFRYRLQNHPVTVYVYNARRVPLRGVLEPTVVRNQAVHVGEVRGYSIAAVEHRGVGYAIATDLKNDESAELVTTIY